MSNQKESFHEESHLVKHRVMSRQTYRHSPQTKLRRKDTRVVSRLSLLNLLTYCVTFLSTNVTQQKSRKSISNYPRKILPRKPCLSPNNYISTRKSIHKESKTQDCVQDLEFRIQSGIRPFEKHLCSYEQNLKNYYSVNQIKSFEMKNDKIKELFYQMKDLMTSEEECLNIQFRDWYLETRNLVTTFSDFQVAENELKISLQSQFQLAVEEIFQNIRKQQITSMKKRIQSFMINI